MSWGPRDWISWSASVKSFFSSHGMIVTKLIIPKDREGEFFMAAIEDPDRYPEIDALADKLHGVKIMFTTKLPVNRFLFEAVQDEHAL